ncbi:MAG: tetratricopeptide repeat protein, partial [Candidatus Bipolaricaulota bacterium]
MEREYQPALDRLATTPNESFANQSWFIPTARLAGLVHGLMGESERSHQAYDTARILLEEEAKKRPDDHRIRSSLGIVYAGLGRKEDAIREGKLGVELYPVSKDAFIGPQREEDLAFIYTLVGEYDLALGKLEYLLSIPSLRMSVPMLRLDPRWDALRDHARYKSLMREHGFDPDSTSASTAKPLSNKTTLAVLPFQNISTDSDTDYLSNEIPASIIDKMSGLSGLSVISRSGSFRFDATKEDASNFGKSLGASVVLTGQLNARGNSLTIRAELVDVATNQQLWSNRYNRELTDIISVEADITQSISNALRIELTQDEREKLARDDTENPDAYRSYLQGRFWLNKRSAEGFAKAIDHFQKAIDHDPEYALAFAGLADTHILLAMHELVLPNEAFREARRAAQAALRIDEMLAEAHVSLGAVQCFFDWDTDSAQESFDRAIELNPAYPTAYHWYAVVLLARGDLPRAIEALEQAHALDPLAPIISWDLASFLRVDRRYQEAERLFRQVLELDASFARAHQELGLLLLEVGQSEEGVAELETANQLASGSSFYAGMLGAAYAKVGRTRDARKLLLDLQERSRTEYVSPVAIAAIHAGLGETSEAVVSMEQALSQRA